MVDSNLDQAIRLLQRFHRSRPHAVIYEGQLSFAIVDHLLEKGSVKEARRYDRAISRIIGSEQVGAKTFLAWGKIYASLHVKGEARRYFEKALALEPANRQAKTELARLK